MVETKPHGPICGNRWELWLLSMASNGADQYRPSHGPLNVGHSRERKRWLSDCSVLFYQQLRTILYKQNKSVTHSHSCLGKEAWLYLYCPLYYIINCCLICMSFNLSIIVLLCLLFYAPVCCCLDLYTPFLCLFYKNWIKSSLMLGLFVCTMQNKMEISACSWSLWK